MDLWMEFTFKFMQQQHADSCLKENPDAQK
jgi:hypothetical protein